MFWLTCAPHLPAIVQEDVLRRHARAQPAGEVVADRLADAEPGLAGGDGVQHVGPADAARRAVERAGAAGVRVGVHQHRAGQRVGLVGDHRVADALVGADIVQPLDAELLGERAPGLHAFRRLRGRRRAPGGRTRSPPATDRRPSARRASLPAGTRDRSGRRSRPRPRRRRPGTTVGDPLARARIFSVIVMPMASPSRRDCQPGSAALSTGLGDSVQGSLDFVALS